MSVDLLLVNSKCVYQYSAVERLRLIIFDNFYDYSRQLICAMLPTKSFIIDLIKRAPFNVRQQISKSSGNYSAAAVACIIRIDIPHHKCYSEFESLAELQNSDFLSDCITDDNVSLFFIKRAIREHDVWSGHVAFPGGYLNENESDLDAVKREVMEEVGVDLNHPDVHWLGRLTTKTFGKVNEKIIIPHAFVCLSRSAEISTGVVDNKNMEIRLNTFDTMLLEHTEVDAVKWVNMKHFLHPDSPDKYHLPTRTMRPKYWEITHALLGVMGLDKLYFPCFKLGGMEITGPVAPTKETARGINEKVIARPPNDDYWVLWGMTYSFVCDLLSIVDVDSGAYANPDIHTHSAESLSRVHTVDTNARNMHTNAHVHGHSRMSRRLKRNVVFAQVDNPVFNFFLNFYHHYLRKTKREAIAMGSNTKRVVKYAVISALCVHAIAMGGILYLSNYLWQYI